MVSMYNWACEEQAVSVDYDLATLETLIGRHLRGSLWGMLIFVIR